MKKNIWLTLLCLSAGVTSNVMGAQFEKQQTAEDSRTAADLAGMESAVLGQLDLDRLNGLVEKYKGSGQESLLYHITNCRNEVQKKLNKREEEKKQQAQAVAQPASSVAQPASSVAQPGWANSNQSNLDYPLADDLQFVYDIEAKGDEEITTGDIEKLNRIKKSRSDLGTDGQKAIDDSIARYEEYSKKRFAQPVWAPAPQYDMGAGANLTSYERELLSHAYSYGYSNKKLKKGDADILAKMLEEGRVPDSGREIVELLLSLARQEDALASDSVIEYPTLEYPTLEYPTLEYPTLEYPTLEDPIFKQSPQTIEEEDLKRGKNLLSIIGKQGDQSSKSDCKTLLNILTKYKNSNAFLEKLNIANLKGWTEYLGEMIKSSDSVGANSDEPSGNTFDFKDYILDQFAETLDEALNSKTRRSALKGCVASTLTMLDGGKGSSIKTGGKYDVMAKMDEICLEASGHPSSIWVQTMSNEDRNDVLETMGDMLRDSRISARVYIGLMRAVGKKYDKMYRFLNIGNNTFSNNFIFDNDDLVEKLLKVIADSEGSTKRKLAKSFQKIVPFVEKCDIKDQGDVVNAVFQHWMDVDMSEAVTAYVSGLSLNNVVSILKSEDSAKKRFQKDLKTFSKDPDTLQGIIEVLNGVKSADIRIMKEKDVLGLLKTAKSYRKGKDGTSENEDSSGKKRQFANKKELAY